MNAKRLLVVLAVTFILSVTIVVPAALAQGSTPPIGFCTTPPPNNPGWQVEGIVERPVGCPEEGPYAMSMEGQVSKYDTWSEMQVARGVSKATLYYEGGLVDTTTSTSAQSENRVSRLIRLDEIYRTQGVHAWLAAAGVKCDVNIDARQPEEETVSDASGRHVVVSGVQVKGSCESIPWPAILTTDRPNEVVRTNQTRQYQPDLRNPSVLYTNVGLRGQGTIWVDGSNWGQLWPEGYVPASQVAPMSAPAMQVQVPQVVTRIVTENVPVEVTRYVTVPSEILVTKYLTTTVEVPAEVQPSPWLRFPWEWVIGVLVALLIAGAIVVGMIWYATWLINRPSQPQPSRIVTASPLPNATSGPWTYALRARGGKRPYVWSVTGAPTWMSMNPVTGDLSGMAVAGDFTFSGRVKDSSTPARSATKNFRLHVA